MAGSRVVELDGKHVLLVNEQIVQNKAAVQNRIALLTKQISETLPAARSALSAETLLAQAQARIDAEVARLTVIKDELSAIVSQLD